MLALAELYAGPDPGPLNKESLARTCVLRLDIESMTGKHN
jgi:hypothetical protein